MSYAITSTMAASLSEKTCSITAPAFFGNNGGEHGNGVTGVHPACDLVSRGGADLLHEVGGFSRGHGIHGADGTVKGNFLQLLDSHGRRLLCLDDVDGHECEQ